MKNWSLRAVLGQRKSYGNAVEKAALERQWKPNPKLRHSHRHLQCKKCNRIHPSENVKKVVLMISFYVILRKCSGKSCT